MADNLQATPRNELLGLLSDAMYGGLDWMKSPERTQQMQGLAGLLESTGIPKTTQRLAYGEPLTNIGRANVPLLKPETAEAAMTIAPFLPKGIRATKDMPVGLSIKDVSKKYPQQAALDLAQQRAALPVSEGGLGLPPNNTAMDRAKAMGFRVNDRVYHGTPENQITEFIPSPHDETAISGISMARDPSIADFYARGRSFTEIPEGANIMPLLIRGKKPQESGKFTDYALEKNLFADRSANLTEAAKDYLEKRNLAGFDMGDLYGDEVQVLNPNRIRSRFAAFDPFRKDVATATAMGVALPDLLAAEPTPQPQSSGLLYPFP